MPHITALSSTLPLVKTLELTSQGITKTPYPMVWEFTSHQFSYTDVASFAKAVQDISARGWCLLKGEVDRELKGESRAGSTDADKPTRWICLDFDGVKADSIDELLGKLGLSDVTHFIQYSSSHGLAPGTISAHVFMLLEGEINPRLLKEWLISKNLEAYRDQITLNRIGTALRWPLDITTCQNDKLLYIAAPSFIGMDDPVAQRFVVVDRSLPCVPGQRVTVNFGEVNRVKTELLHELRKAGGYVKLRDAQYKVNGGQEYLSKPGLFTITGVKEARGYRYFNFNGGNSWAYYQPEDDYRYVYNFKGEPAYLLEEITPDYYADLVKRERQEHTAHTNYFSFISPADDVIYNAVLDKRTNELSLFECSTERRAHMFLKGNGMPVPEELPLMDVIYDPQSSVVINESERLVNIYKPPQLAYTPGVVEAPEIIMRVIQHAVGRGAVLENFLDFIRLIVVEKVHVGIAYVLSGIEGTGKGVLFNYVLTPLVGASNAVMVPMTRLVDPFNGWLEDKLLIGIDEAQYSALGREAANVQSRMKTWITEPIVQIRKLHMNARSVVNRAHFILMSNAADPAILSLSDRRHQVGAYQDKRIELSSDDLLQIHASIDNFYSYLVQRRATSVQDVRKIVDHADRRLLVDRSLSTIDSVADKLLSGDIEFLFSQLDPGIVVSTLENLELLNYKRALLQISLRSINSPGKGYIARDELYALMQFLVGNIRRSPHHFTSLLKHHRIYLQKETPEGRPTYCMHLQWANKTQDWYRQYMSTYLQDVLVEKNHKLTEAA